MLTGFVIGWTKVEGGLTYLWCSGELGVVTRTRGTILGDVLLGICLVTLVLVIGTRDVSVGTDTSSYLEYYHRVQSCRCLDGRFELGFKVLTLLIAITGASATTYLSILAGLLIVLTWAFLKNLSSLVRFNSAVRWKVRLAVLACVLISPFFFQGSVNVLRHGLSAFFLLNATILMLRGKWFGATTSAVLSVLFHRTALLYLVVLPLFLTVRARRYKMLFAISLLLLAIAYGLGFTEELTRRIPPIAGMNVHQMFAEYRAFAVHYTSGVRMDFLLFSVGWFVLGLVASKYIVPPIYRPLYEDVVNLYGVFLIPFFLFGWGNYSDRLLFVPWQLIPAVVGGAIALGRLRIHSGGSLYLIAVIVGTLGMILSVLQNQALLMWVIRITS